MEILAQDLRFGVRMLVKHKGVTLIALLSLSLGIGANTALFSVVDALLLKTLPVNEPERLVLFRCVAPAGFSPGGYAGFDDTDEIGQRIMTSFPYQTFQVMRGQQDALSDVFAFGDIKISVNANGQSEISNGQCVSGNYYRGLDVHPLLGRVLIDDDDQPRSNPVAVLSYRFWNKRYRNDPTVIGKQIYINNLPFTIVGITPEGFEGTMQAGSTQDITIPLAWEPQLYQDRTTSRMSGAGQWWLRIMGRLKPSETADNVCAQLQNPFRQSVVEHRTLRQIEARTAGRNAVPSLESKDYPRLYLDPGGRGEMNERRRYAPSLYMLLVVVGLVLLVACANVANLLLSRSSSRRKEIAVRVALGASRGRLVRQLLTESVVLALLGGIVGIGFAVWIKDVLLAVSDWGGTAMTALDPKLDWRVLSFTFTLSLLVGIIFGLAPAWRATRVDLALPLKNKTSSGESRSLLSRALVVLQFSLALILMAVAGLFVRTLLNLQHVEPGFNINNLLLFDTQPVLIGYDNARVAQLYTRLAERLEAVPGVQQVTFSGVPLLARVQSTRSVYLGISSSVGFDSEGRIRPNGQCKINQVRENFLEAMGIPLLLGRTLNSQDAERAPRIVIVNQSFAKQYFPNDDPVGKRFTFEPSKPDEIEIIGVARDAKYTKQRDEIAPTAYIPWQQGLSMMEGEATFELRTAADPLNSVDAIRQAISEVDINLPLKNVRSQSEQANETLAMERLLAKLMALFGLLAAQLACIGLFGLVAYSVSQRTQEIGIRMAVGADRSDVLKMIMSQGMSLASLGLVGGLAVALVLAKLLDNWITRSQMLYGIRLSDPSTYAMISILLLLVAAPACLIPALRAARVDPMTALRCE